MKNIIDKLGVLATYSLLLPDHLRQEFANEIELSKLSLLKSPAILNHYLSSLAFYSNFLTEKDKNEFVKEIEDIKKEVVSAEHFLIEQNKNSAKLADFSLDSLRNIVFSLDEDEEGLSEEELLSRRLAKESENLWVSFLQSGGALMEKADLSEAKENTLYFISRYVIPRYTKKGLKASDNNEISGEELKTFRLINEKSSIADLYIIHASKYECFMEFMDIIYHLRMDNHIDFIKIRDLNYDQAWVRFGQMLDEFNIVNEININKAYKYFRYKENMRIGEAMINLQFITEEMVKNTFKLQKWFATIVDFTIFVEGISHTQNHITDAKNVLNVLNFIIPVLKQEVKDKLLQSTKSGSSLSLIDLIDGKKSLLEIFYYNKEGFGEGFTNFLRLIRKIDSQGIIRYKKNEKVRERDLSIRFGELAIVLGFISNKKSDDFLVTDSGEKKVLIGESMLEKKLITQEDLDFILELQKWLNNLLDSVSPESHFVRDLKYFFENYFKLKIVMGKFVKRAFYKDLFRVIELKYKFSGDLDGDFYYIIDRNLAEKLLRFHLSNSVEADNLLISEFFNMITDKVLGRLYRRGISVSRGLPEVKMGRHIEIAEKKELTLITFTIALGRFIIGFRPARSFIGQTLQNYSQKDP